MTAPSLFNPKADRPCYLITDASKGSKEVGGMIGWVVVQEGDVPGVWLPILFGSRSLRDHERNYTISSLEQLAIIEAYRDAYYILHGRETIILCDNKPTVDLAESEKDQRFLKPIAALLSDPHSHI